ncbi:MAG: hypothetical protein KVP17_005290 [Porospora cf. gigantea B]|uniref:uncharacterized protein n=1 Tax=Porospora cf. gigantea B TaxID=2853592 RepID=UPI0035718F65|nr:MAG: hypothetical protein KVP17_005290 [Porospora cf. gigantea B]
MARDFSVVVPGRPLLGSEAFTTLVSGRVCACLPRPADVNAFVVALEQPLASPEQGLSIYFSFGEDATTWEFLGFVHNEKPSTLISTGWSLNPDIATRPQIILGLMVEPAADIQQKDLKAYPDAKLVFAHKIALNLFRFLESFGQGLPQSAFQAWLAKFERRYALDPNFVLNTE